MVPYCNLISLPRPELAVGILPASSGLKLSVECFRDETIVANVLRIQITTDAVIYDGATETRKLYSEYIEAERRKVELTLAKLLPQFFTNFLQDYSI